MWFGGIGDRVIVVLPDEIVIMTLHLNYILFFSSDIADSIYILIILLQLLPSSGDRDQCYKYLWPKLQSAVLRERSLEDK